MRRSFRSTHLRSVCQQVLRGPLGLDYIGPHTTMASSFAASTNTKKIRLFRNGDENFFGKTLVLNPRQIRSYDRLLETVTSHVGLGQAVRSIRTPRHGTIVQSLDDLEDQQDYVAVGIGRFKSIGYLLFLIYPLWLGNVAFWAWDMWSRGREFDSRPVRCPG